MLGKLPLVAVAPARWAALAATSACVAGMVVGITALWTPRSFFGSTAGLFKWCAWRTSIPFALPEAYPRGEGNKSL
jgi:hypothetical protein